VQYKYFTVTVTDRLTDRQTDRQTDHATPSVTTGRVYAQDDVG